MRSGEKALWGGMALFVAVGVAWKLAHPPTKRDEEIPYYSTASHAVAVRASELIDQYRCKDCHSLWTTHNMFQFVPAPMLDGIGSLRSEQWLYDYLSAPNPQAILKSRLKAKYRMPSYAAMPEPDRRVLVDYLSSLRVKNWYLDQTHKLEQDKLTGSSTAQQ